MTRMKNHTDRLYGNWVVLHPDGGEMFRCDQKRADWYLSRDLAKQINDTTLQFTFMPGGRGHSEEPYYRQSLPNICFVCGSTELLSKHHVVPYQYRRIMPTEFKVGNCHDVIWLCRPHHDHYETDAQVLRAELAKKHRIPIYRRSPDSRRLRHARGDLDALTHNPMPPERRTFLEARVRENARIDSIQPDTLVWLESQIEAQELADIEQHRQATVGSILGAFGSFHEFMRFWRQHFLDTMNPRHMPQHWSVDYRKV